jgi:hypothetical protein
MTADTPYILDEECRECPKLVELEEILKNLMSVEDHKVIIFSEWERMLILVKELAEKLKLNYAWHTGSVPQEKRRKDIQRFKEDATCRLFLTTDAGSAGLNLQAANVVINLDLPWNPAKLEQRIARAWRKYQTRSVQVIHLVTENTIEHRMMSTLVMKQALADVVLDRLEERDEMPFPTASRAEAVQQLEALTGLLESKEMPKEEAKNEVAVSPPQELMARFSHRMHLLEQYDDKLLMVVDQKDHQLNAESLSQLTKTTIEVLDFETYQTLDRLASMGLIQLNHKEKQTFFQSPLIQKTQSPTYLRKLEEALQVFKEGERLLRMSNLLKSGGFLQEALPSAKEAFNKGVESLKLLDLPLDSLALSLKEGQDNPQKPELFLETLTSWMEQISEKLTQLSL